RTHRSPPPPDSRCQARCPGSPALPSKCRIHPGRSRPLHGFFRFLSGTCCCCPSFSEKSRSQKRPALFADWYSNFPRKPVKSLPDRLLLHNNFLHGFSRKSVMLPGTLEQSGHFLPQAVPPEDRSPPFPCHLRHLLPDSEVL